MFAVETFQPPYCEERTAAEAAKKLAEQQKAGAISAAQTKAPAAASPLQPQQHPSNLSHTPLLPPPALSRPGSSTVLGSIFQGFVKRAPGSPAITPAATPPRESTPSSSSEKQKKDMEALIAEMKRDADICAQPGWR